MTVQGRNFRRQDRHHISDKDILDYQNWISHGLIADPKARVFKLFQDLDELVETQGLDKVFTGTGEKLAVKQLLNAIRPTSLRDLIEKELKFTKASVSSFYKLVQKYALNQEQFHVAPKKIGAAAKNDSKPNRPPAGKSGSGFFQVLLLRRERPTRISALIGLPITRHLKRRRVERAQDH